MDKTHMTKTHQSYEAQYLNLASNILSHGIYKKNRTGTSTYSLFGASLDIDVSNNFPLLTTKKVYYKSAFAEMLGFLRGYNYASQFRDLGCNVWDADANENKKWLKSPFREGYDDLGRIYGVQWREWHAVAIADDSELDKYILDGWTASTMQLNNYVVYKLIDQVQECIHKIIHEPNDRRIIWTAWNPAELNMMALPPCHTDYQWYPDTNEGTLSLKTNIRSNDMFLGNPFNVAQQAWLLYVISALTGYKPGRLFVSIGDAHVYENHVSQIKTMLSRAPKTPPTAGIADVPVMSCADDATNFIDNELTTDMLVIQNYEHHSQLSGAMATERDQ